MKKTVLLVALLAAVALAKDPAVCGAVPSDAKDPIRNLSACLTGLVGACSGLDKQVFNNSEGKLPAAGKNETYYEGKVGVDRAGAAGVRRLVFLVLGGEKPKILHRYFSTDHYTTFCALP